MARLKLSLLLIIMSILILIPLCRPAVIGIDLGTEFYKAVVVKPGSPFAILENTSSKRKTETAVTLTSEERAFERDAINQAVRHSDNAFLRTLELIGAEYDENTIADLNTKHMNKLLKDERGNVGYDVTIEGDREFVNREIFVEEVLAMILDHAKHLAKQQGAGTVSDVTITVPEYFTSTQRTMLMDAAHLAGFNVLTLLHENTAAALMYGIDTKNLEFPHQVLLVNMGAANLEISLARLDKVKPKGNKEKGTLSIEILAEASAQDIGGYAFDYELVKIIADRFDNQDSRKDKSSILENEKIVRRLMKEVPKFKEILSANKEVPIRILEITDDQGVEFTLQRSEFEDKIAHIVEQIRPVFQKILEKYSIDDINEVEILGGGLRVPKVKEFISSIVNDKALSTHLNSDEAMAFGSAYIAANFSSSYQVQKVYMYQRVPYSIYLNLTQTGGCSTEETEECFTKHVQLYSDEKDNLGAKKTITVSHHLVGMDAVLYRIDSQGVEHVLSTHKIRNTDKATSSAINERSTIVNRKMSLSFKYDKSGVLSLKKAEAFLIEEKEEKVAPQDNSTDAEPETRVKEKTHTFTLKVTDKVEGAQPLNAAQKSKAKKRLNDFEKRDKLQEKKVVAQNEYETLIYSSRDYLADEENAPYLKDQDEKEKLLLFLNEEESWMYGDGATSDYETYKNKIKVLQKKINPIKKRKTNREDLSEKIEKSRAELDTNEKAFKKYTKAKKWLPVEPLQEYEALLTKAREFFDSKQELLDNTPLNEKLSFTIKELNSETSIVIEKMKSIKRIKKPRDPVKDVESHGELKEQPEGGFRIDSFDSTKDSLDDLNSKFIKIDSPKEKKPDVNDAEEVNVEEVENIEGKFDPRDIKAHVKRMQEDKQLRDDVLDGKINYEDLTPEQIERIHNV